MLECVTGSASALAGLSAQIINLTDMNTPYEGGNELKLAKVTCFVHESERKRLHMCFGKYNLPPLLSLLELTSVHAFYSCTVI